MRDTAKGRGTQAMGSGRMLVLTVLGVLLCGGVWRVSAGGDEEHRATDAVATLTRLLEELETRADRLQDELESRDRQLQEALMVREGRVMREALSEADATGASLAWSLNDAGLLLMGEGHVQAAALLFERALQNVERHLEPLHPARGTLLQNTGEALLGMGNAEAAEPRFREAALVFGTATGAAHPRLAAVLNGWATALARLQRFEDAETLYRRAIRIYEERKQPRVPDLAVPMHNLAVMLVAQGRAAEAGELLEMALQVLRKSGEGESDSALAVLRALVRQCRATGALDQASRYEKQAGVLAVKLMERATGAR